MKNKVQITKNLPFYGLIILSFFPLLNIKGVSISIIFFSLFSLIYLFSDLKNRWSPDIKNFIYISIPFGLYIIGLSYTSDIQQGFKTIETGLPLFVFPFLYFIILGKKYIIDLQMKNKLLNSFILSSSLFILLILIYLTYNGALSSFFNEEMFLKTTQNKGRDLIRSSIQNTPFFGEHPTYFGLISIFTLLLSVFQLSKKPKRYIFTIVLGVTGIFVSGSKMSIITFIILTIIFLFTFTKSKKNKLITIFSFIFFITFIFTTFPSLSVRFNQVLHTKFEAPKGLRYNSTNVRTAVYLCTFDNIKTAPIWGHGTGGYREGMRNCFKQFDTNVFKKDNYYYNSHNQYLSFILSNGIIGFLFIILWIIIIFHISIINNDQLLLFSMIIFVIMFFTENLLERQTGNVMFSFLVFMLYKYNLQKND